MIRDNPEITGLLEAWSGGDSSALDRLVPMVFDDLHKMARFFFLRESATHTLQPTALISELYFRLRGQKRIEFANREDFFNFAADVMRHFLIDYARKRSAMKRGGEATVVPIDLEILGPIVDQLASEQLLDLNRALEDLREDSPREAQVVTLRYFLGLEIKEIATLLEISESTVKRDWKTSRYRLARALKRQEPDE